MRSVVLPIYVFPRPAVSQKDLINIYSEVNLTEPVRACFQREFVRLKSKKVISFQLRNPLFLNIILLYRIMLNFPCFLKYSSFLKSDYDQYQEPCPF